MQWDGQTSSSVISAQQAMLQHRVVGAPEMVVECMQ